MDGHFTWCSSLRFQTSLTIEVLKLVRVEGGNNTCKVKRRRVSEEQINVREGEAQSPSRFRGEGCLQILEDAFDDADLSEPVKAHARVDQSLAARNWVAEAGGHAVGESRIARRTMCCFQFALKNCNMLLCRIWNCRVFAQRHGWTCFTIGNDFLDGRIAVRHFPRKGKHDDVLLDSQECKKLGSSWFFGVVGSAVGKNGSHEGKLCWMPETVTIFERKGLRVHVGHGGKRHRSQRSGVGAVTPVVDIATTLRSLDGQRTSILR